MLATSFVALGLNACSGTGARIEGSQCPKRWDPVQMNIHPAAKLAMKPSTLPDGEYRLARAMLHFHGDPTEKSTEGFQVLIKDEVPAHAKEAKLVTQPDCFRNAKVDTAYAASVSGLSAVVIKDGAVVSSSAKEYGFTMSEFGQFELKDAAVERKASSIDHLFQTSTETFVVKRSDFDYEIRTKGRGTNGEYALVSYLHRIL